MGQKFTHSQLMAVYNVELAFRLPQKPWPTGYKIPLKAQQDAMKAAYANFGVSHSFRPATLTEDKP